MDGNEESRLFDRTKLAVDVAKHMSTLATGAVVLLTAFLDKLPRPPVAVGWLIASVIAFAVCVTFCFLYLFFLGIPRHWNARFGPAKKHATELFVISIGCYLTFIFGMFCLIRFSIDNLGQLSKA